MPVRINPSYLIHVENCAEYIQSTNTHRWGGVEHAVQVDGGGGCFCPYVRTRTHTLVYICTTPHQNHVRCACVRVYTCLHLHPPTPRPPSYSYPARKRVPNLILSLFQTSVSSDPSPDAHISPEAPDVTHSRHNRVRYGRLFLTGVCAVYTMRGDVTAQQRTWKQEGSSHWRRRRRGRCYLSLSQSVASRERVAGGSHVYT